MKNNKKFMAGIILLLWLGISLSTQAGIHTRILGGTAAKTGEWPSIVLLNLTSDKGTTTRLCGGSLISKKWVLTAAHCFFKHDHVQDIFPAGVQAYFGIQRVSQRHASNQIAVQNIVIHPSYNDAAPYDYDFALLELAHDADQPTMKLSVDAPTTGTLATVAGWGIAEVDHVTQLPLTESYADQLQTVQLPIVSNQACAGVMTSTITGNMMCAGYTEGGKDSCRGDSGGPLITQKGAERIQVGIISFGSGCAQPGKYGVYSRITNASQWINDFVPEAGLIQPIQQPQEVPTLTDYDDKTQTNEKVNTRGESENREGRIDVSNFGGGTGSWFLIVTCTTAFLTRSRMHKRRPQTA